MLEIKLKNTYKKLIHYFSIFTIILGTTFGSINSAYAADVVADGVAIANADIVDTSDLKLTDDETVVLAADDTIRSIDTLAADATLDISGFDLTVTGDITTADGFTLAITLDAGEGLLLGGNVTPDDDDAISIILEANSFFTLNGTAAQTITGTVDGSAGGAGILNVTNTSGTVTFSGIIGATDLASISTSANTTSVFGAAVDTVLLTQAGTATFQGAVGGITTATLTGDTTFDSTLTAATVDINSGTQTFSGKVTASTKIDVAGASTIVNIDAAPDTAQLVVAEGTVNISLQNIDIDDLDLNSGDIVIEKTVTNGQTVFITDGQTTAGVGGGEIYMPVNLSNGQTLTLFNDTDTAADGIDVTTASVEAVVVDTAVTNYVASISGVDIVLTSTDKSSTTTASELGVTTNDAKALLQLRNAAISDANADGNAEDAVFNALNAKGGFSATEDTSLAKQAAPQTDMISGSSLASKAVTGTVQGIISNRMASLRSGDAYYGMGMSAGNMTAKSGFIQAFGSEVEQKNKTVGSGTQYGYESSSAGFALGFDGTTDTGATVGLSFSMSNTDLDGKGTGRAKNDIDSYTASLYWDKTGQNGYVEGSLTYGLNENKTSRLVNTAGLSRTYTGSYDSNQVSLSLGGGAPNAVGASGYVTPFIGVTGTYIKTDAYTESSTTAGDNLRLRVAQDDINSLVGKVGVKYHNVTDKGTPMISLSLNNEFGDDTINSTNTYQGGGSSFTTSTDVEPLSATLGLGYSYGSDTASIEFAYEAEANDDKYLGHYGSIKIVGKF